MGATTSTMSFGSSAQAKLEEISQAMLADVHNKDVGSEGDSLRNIVTTTRGFSVSELDVRRESGWPENLLGKAALQFAEFTAKYEDVQSQIDRITNDLLGHEHTLLNDIKLLDLLHEKTLEFYDALALYIAVGEEKLTELDSHDIPEREAGVQAAPKNHQVTKVQELHDLCAVRDDLERRVHDLKLTRQITMQSLPSIRLVQENDKSLVTKINSTLINTVPLWETQLVQTVTIQRSAEAAEIVRDASDLTDEMLNSIAVNLRESNKLILEELERSVFDIEAIKQDNADLIGTINESLAIADEGKAKRATVEQELKKMGTELRNTLAAAKAGQDRRQCRNDRPRIKGTAGVRPSLQNNTAAIGLLLLALVGCDKAQTTEAQTTEAQTTSVVLEPGLTQPPGQSNAYVEPSAASLDLARYYESVQNNLLTRGLLRTDGGGPDTPYDADDLARNFETIAFYNEYPGQAVSTGASRTSRQLSRWSGTVRIMPEFGPSVALSVRQQDAARVNTYVSRLSRLTGHPISTVSRNANFHVFVAGEDDTTYVQARLRHLIPDIGQAQLDLFDNLPRSFYCFVFASATSGAPQTYTRAIALVRSEHPELARLSCIHEEIAQGLGLPNDSPSARPSIFNDDDEFALLTSHDEKLLTILYDRRLKPGITADEALPVVRIIARELMGQSP